MSAYPRNQFATEKKTLPNATQTDSTCELNVVVAIVSFVNI